MIAPAFMSLSAGAAGAATTSTPTRGTTVAGVHDTAINSCDNNGQRPVGSITAADLAAAKRTLDDPGFDSSGITTVRVTVPWDIDDVGAVWGSKLMTSSSQRATDAADLRGIRACLNSWLQAAHAHNITPEIDFRGDQGFVKDGTTQALMPSIAEYTQAMQDFNKDYVACNNTTTACQGTAPVKIIGAWNEPDNGGNLSAPGKRPNVYDLLFPDNRTHLGGRSCPTSPSVTNCGATMAGQMWRTDHDIFTTPGVTVAAGDFSGALGLEQMSGGACTGVSGCNYLKLYNNAAKAGGAAPTRWAVHPYGDVKYYQSHPAAKSPTDLARFAAALRSDGYGTSAWIWINEISACDTYSSNLSQACAPYASGRTSYTHNKVAQIDYLVGAMLNSIPSGDPRVGRIDYYCFNAGEGSCNSDWALENKGATTLNAAGQAYSAWAHTP